MKIRLALIYGSRTCEHDVSIISALQAAQHVNPDDYDLIYVYIDQNGEWYTGEKLADISLYRNFDKRAVVRVIPMGVEGKLHRRLIEMGLTPGTRVTVTKRAPLGDPIEIRLRGYELTLRADDASKILVTPDK